MSEVQRSIKQGANKAVSTVQNTQVLQTWARLGYAARGVLYGLIGFLAIQLALTGQGKITDQTGALGTLAAQPSGRILLTIIVIGLAGYAAYCFLRAIVDPFDKGTSGKGIIIRIGYFVTGVTYVLLVLPASNMIRGGAQSGGGSQKMQGFAADILTQPWGPFAVGLVGVFLMGLGVYEIYFGYKEGFARNFEHYRMSASQRTWAMRMGKFGYMALGVVVGIMGFLALLAATTLDPSKVGGMDGALAFLIHQPYGPVLLAIVAAGLIAYAIYSLMGALWFRIKVK